MAEVSALARWSRLGDVVKSLSGADSIEQAVQIIRFSARVIANADGITIVRREGEMVHYIAEDAVSPLWAGHRFPIESCVSGLAMLARRPVVIPDVFADPRVPHYAYEPTFVKSMAMFPVGVEEPMAAIGAYWRTAGEIDSETINLFSALARSTSAVLDNLEVVRYVSQQETRLRVVGGTG
jgi:GAF domain-containing protein